MKNKTILQDLHCADGAAFDFKDSRCLPGTRFDLLEEIMTWSDDPCGKCIFWMSGWAGTGKSTISRTVAQTFAEQGRLGASFFFTKDNGDLGSTKHFATTLARQLANKQPAFRSSLCTAIDTDGSIINASPQAQWGKLIIEPLEKSSVASPILFFVIDALDECDENGIAILPLLTQVEKLRTVQLRVFVTSRPESDISLQFKEMSEHLYQYFNLNEVAKVTVEKDISAFVKLELQKIQKQYPRLRDWPSSRQIQLLVQRAEGLFIYASTACLFIGDKKKRNPEARLRYMIPDDDAGQGAVQKPAQKLYMLDKMYTEIMRQSVIGDSMDQEEEMDQEDEELAWQFKRIVGSIAVVFDPLSTTALADLLGVEEEEIDRNLADLHSVLDVPESKKSPIRVLHTSFLEFLLDKGRCSDKERRSKLPLDKQRRSDPF
jgi:NACHT domain